MMKKYLISLAAAISVCMMSLIIYAMETFSIEELIICSTSSEATFIPQDVCEFYLTHYRADEDDIHDLTQGAGLSFVAATENHKKRYRLLDYFLAKGLDVNSISQNDGLTPLHSAILLNDVELVQYYLSKGADPLKVDRDNRMTAYQYVDFLIAKSKDDNNSRIKIKEMLFKISDK